ncbi:TIGR00730 family Rossman fold protein [Chitinophaga sp. 212800010-3]|uniref:LOG family protein n=1 Tax=unclassified Chitinophaga TaxID=2619133 RepID=UPI002DE66014|nr:Cytokinin riboside 5'-monophosphate phosphoribohydrolase [Chitinophaga sp. 212800010-3]
MEPLYTSPGKSENVKKLVLQEEEKHFLEGPGSRLKELKFTLRMLTEFIRGFRVFHFAGPCIAIFGSARVKPESEYYEMARQMGAGIAGIGFSVMTGGGPGIMEAANRGAREANGKSVGCNIQLPAEQQPNQWMDRHFDCHYLFVRKVLMFKYSYGFVIMPGGIGTLDEFSEALTLIQTHKILNFPIVLMSKGYWEPLMPLFHKMIDSYMLEPDIMKYILLTDSVTEALEHLQQFVVTKYRLMQHKELRPIALLGESAPQ